LLVKTGLFSAVLTAFLVESYQNLQVDKADVEIALLQQIAARNISIPSNSVAPLSFVSDFIAPKWAIRINVLWFSSLLCSLAVGSFGILVKQWLQEYLSLDSMSAPIRVHDHIERRQALQKWRVFEIAAVLPLVLQIAFLLFFVGMCYFTVSVQKTISFASISLVGGWAFIFLSTVIAPLFWPRCPFRSPWLNTLQNWIGFFAATPTKDSGEGKEREIVEDIDPFDCLLLVDETMRDDGLLEAICEAYESSQPHPTRVVPFVSTIIGHRLDTKGIKRRDLSCIPDFRSLSLQCWVSITDLVAINLLKQLRDEPIYGRVDLTDKVDAMLILLARSPGQLSAIGKKAVHECMAHRSWGTICSAIAECQSGGFVPMARPLLDASELLPPHKAMELYFKCLCPSYMTHRHTGNPGLLHLLRDTTRHPELLTENPIITDLFTVLNEIMITQVLNLSEDERNYRDGSIEAFMVIWEFWKRPGHRSAAMQTVYNLWNCPKSNALLFVHCTAMHPPYRVPAVADIICEVFKESTQSGEFTYSIDLRTSC
jgi:hypothetical protein